VLCAMGLRRTIVSYSSSTREYVRNNKATKQDDIMSLFLPFLMREGSHRVSLQFPSKYIVVQAIS
jgi:hypothetical protein